MLFLRDKTRDVMSYVLNVNISLDLRFCENIREVADHSGFQVFFSSLLCPHFPDAAIQCGYWLCVGWLSGETMLFVFLSPSFSQEILDFCLQWISSYL